MNLRLLGLALLLLASPALAASPAALRPTDAATASTLALASGVPSASLASLQLPPLMLTGELPSLPSDLPLDDGGGASVRSDIVPVLAILLSALVGFGTGHLIANDREGFILFLVVDIVIWAVSGVLWGVTGQGWLYGLGGVAVLISHLIQVLDVYPKVSGGARIVERARERSIVLASAAAPDPVGAVTTRTFGFAF